MAYGKEARRLAIRGVYEAAQVKDNPADLINVALETLIKERYELPAFSTPDRLVRRVRTLVNRRIFQTVLSRLTEADLTKLDTLLLVDDHTHRSPYHRLKQLPKQPTLIARGTDLTTFRLRFLLACSRIEAAKRAGKPIGICGQAPSDYPEFARWLVLEFRQTSP